MRRSLAIADFVDLKSPYTLGHARAVAELVTGAATQLGMAEDESRSSAERRSSIVSGGSVCRTRSGTSLARSGRVNGNAFACTPT